jgi:hypothetical protein
MLKKAASGVLGSTRSSPYPIGKELPCSSGWAGENGYACGLLSPAAFVERHVLACRGWAGETDGLFEHPTIFSIILVAALERTRV